MSRALCALSLVALTGCTLVPRRYAPVPAAQDRYYVASFEIERETQGAVLAERAESLARDASAVLQIGKRVAFFPPDTCLDTSATPNSGGDREYIEMRCGVLMSSLETHMARAGYEVVSWQALKPSMVGMGNSQAGGTALERARGLGVDVLFEVDQLAAGDREIGQTRATGIDFFQANSTSREPLNVSRETALQCKGISDRIVGLSNTPEPSATLSSKAVDVPTGRAVWYFQKTRSKEVDRSTDVARDYHFVARGTQPDPGTPSPLYNGKQRAGNVLANQVGSWLFVIGAALAGGGAALVAETGDGALLGVGSAVAGTGVLFWGGGGAMINAGNAEASKPIPVPGSFAPSYPSPSSVVCRTDPVTPPWLRAQVDDDDDFEMDAPAPSGVDSSFSFQDQTVSSADPNQGTVERLFDEVVQDFVGELTALSASHTPGAMVGAPTP